MSQLPFALQNTVADLILCLLIQFLLIYQVLKLQQQALDIWLLDSTWFLKSLCIVEKNEMNMTINAFRIFLREENWYIYTRNYSTVINM
jgi:hypothetical protein